MLQNPSFFKIFLKEHFPQSSQKGVCNKIFTTKETYPHVLKFFILFYRLIGRGLILQIC